MTHIVIPGLLSLKPIQYLSFPKTIQYLSFPKSSLGTEKSSITNQGIGNEIEVY